MSSGQQQAKQPVSAVLAGPYGHPFHPILVTVPIGAWVASVVFDLASHLTGDAVTAAKASLWLIGLGVLGALAAATAGFLDLLAIPPGTRAFRAGLLHMSLNLAVTAAFAVGYLWRRGSGPEAPVGAGPLLLSAAALVALTVAGSLGGKLAYRYGVRVADEATQATGFRRD